MPPANLRRIFCPTPVRIASDVACNDESAALFAACGLDKADDDGVCVLTDAASAGAFLSACKALRYWPREAALDA